MCWLGLSHPAGSLWWASQGLRIGREGVAPPDPFCVPGHQLFSSPEVCPSFCLGLLQESFIKRLSPPFIPAFLTGHTWLIPGGMIVLSSFPLARLTASSLPPDTPLTGSALGLVGIRQQVLWAYLFISQACPTPSPSVWAADGPSWS